MLKEILKYKALLLQPMTYYTQPRNVSPAARHCRRARQTTPSLRGAAKRRRSNLVFMQPEEAGTYPRDLESACPPVFVAVNEPITKAKIMNTSSNILKDLVISKERFTTPEEGILELKGKEALLEAAHIYLENIDPKVYGRKDYFDIHRQSKLSKLDAWIYNKLIIQSEYRSYLDKYSLLKNKLHFTDIDEYILKKHYRIKAIRILSEKFANFDLEAWQKPRYGFHYERKTNFTLKDGTRWKFDFRNALESLFILNNKGERVILACGGSGGSFQRCWYTIYTVMFYELSKHKIIKHHLFKYNSLNKFEYIKTFNKPIITIDLGCNYDISENLRKEIIENSVDFQKIRNKLFGS